MIIEHDIKLDFSDVLIKPKRSTLKSRSDVSLVKTFKPKYGNPFSGVPIMAANMATGSFAMVKAFKKEQMFVAVAKHNNDQWLEEYKKDSDILKYGFYTIGMNENEFHSLCEFAHEIYANNSKDLKHLKIVIDIANGYTQKFADFVKKVRSHFSHHVIIAGNVATPEMTEELIIAGADYVKIGIGPGSVCTTRKQTGIGYPQLSAAIECSDAAHGLGGGIILDGGMRTPGDVAKAFCANADLVMMGGMFSGTDEMDGEVYSEDFKSANQTWHNGKWINDIETRKFKVFYGMSSDMAQDLHFGGNKDYRASEGTVEYVDYIGPVSKVIKDLLGGLRSTGTYIGAENIKDFGKCATFVRVTHIHDKF